jgi:uncharacterized protein (TIGR02246 family)
MDTSAAPRLTDATLPEADLAAITQVVKDVEDGFNANDPDLLTAHVAEDAVVVNARGAVLRGRAAVDEANRVGLAGPLREATAHYRVSDVAAVAPGVVVATKSAWSTPEAADAGAAPEMLALYVLVQRDGRWWIVRRQNTLVAG